MNIKIAAKKIINLPFRIVIPLTHILSSIHFHKDDLISRFEHSSFKATADIFAFLQGCR